VADRFRPEAGEDVVRRDREIVAGYGVAPPYIFALGNIHPRKNLARVLSAYERLATLVPDRPVMVWGGIKRWDSEGLIERARQAGVILTGFIALEDLPSFYRQAEMLVYPSLYEGFGLPPVEALACGTPVVTSNTTALPEAVGDAALKVDPTSVRAIAEAMARLLVDEALREELRVRGFDQAQQFTWKRTAARLVHALSPAVRVPYIVYNEK
jgi:glycosyltransferase involved in cell wall biosynthesis